MYQRHVFDFYDGMSADGSTALLPASPVTELLEFLKSGMDWRLPDSADDLTRRVGGRLPGLIEHYLLTRHEAMSFERSLFYRDDGVINDDDPVSALTSVIDDKSVNCSHSYRLHHFGKMCVRCLTIDCAIQKISRL